MTDGHPARGLVLGCVFGALIGALIWVVVFLVSWFFLTGAW